MNYLCRLNVWAIVVAGSVAVSSRVLVIPFFFFVELAMVLSQLGVVSLQAVKGLDICIASVNIKAKLIHRWKFLRLSKLGITFGKWKRNSRQRNRTRAIIAGRNIKLFNLFYRCNSCDFRCSRNRKKVSSRLLKVDKFVMGRKYWSERFFYEDINFY